MHIRGRGAIGEVVGTALQMGMNMGIDNITLNNGVQIPQLGLGVFQTPSGEVTVEAVREALKTGYRHIDTAMIYHNEESVGEGIRQSGVAREEIFVTTKLWNDDVRAGRAKEAFEESLKRLGLDYVDLYLIHWPADGWEKAWEQLQELAKEKRVRAIGVSNFQQHHLERLLSMSDVVPAADQIESSPQFANQELIDFAHSKGIAIEAWSPLGGTGGNLLSDPRLAPIAEHHGKSAAQVVIRWHLQRGVIVLPKSTHAERIRQNFDVADFTLDDQEMAAINAIDTGKRNGADPDNFNF
ncbi:putative glyoxal reductase [Bifidobacterium tsurumiense]|uniref:Putative glyoxal reductase n=2 Tax=Bifidobacterium tsurumiense TaxID=356829 RepID=A0A087EKU2_9BIFI|nr:putative glyoxal reductase [Bifidobacterium tsurumiense]